MSSPCFPTSRRAASPGAAGRYRVAPGRRARAHPWRMVEAHAPKPRRCATISRSRTRTAQRFWLFRRGDGVDRAHRRPQLVSARGVRMTYVELQVDQPFQLPARRLQRARICSRPPPCSAIRRSASPTATRRRPGPGAARRRRDRRPAGRRLPARSDGRQRACWSGPRTAPAGRASPACSPLGKSRAEPQQGREGPMLPPLGGCRGLFAKAWSRPWSRTRPDAVAETALAQIARHLRRPRPSARSPIAAARATRPGSIALDAMARRFGVRSLATGDVLYHSPDKRMLQDVVTAIRDKCTIDDLGFRRERFADRHLKSAGGDGAPLRRFPRRDPRPAPTSPSAAPSRFASSATNIPTRS